MSAQRGWLAAELEHRGVSRREFMGFCATMAAALALPDAAAAQIARAIAEGREADAGLARVPGLRGQHRVVPARQPSDGRRSRSSTCCRSTITRPSWRRPATSRGEPRPHGQGTRRRLHRRSSKARSRPAPTAPTARSAASPRVDIAREVCGSAAATIAIGTCAAFGGIPAAAPNPTGALGVADAVPGVKNLINLSACPANVENLTALLVYYLTFKRWPPLDHYRRPLFAYGKSIHDNCERRAHFDAGQYVEAWGDAGHRAGYCLYKMGCKGPVDVPELPERQVERRHQLADRLRPSVHRLLRAELLGSHDAVLPAPARHPGLRRGLRHRHDRRRSPCSASAPRSPATA